MVIHDAPARIDDILSHHAMAILPFEQRRQARGELFRQHGEVAHTCVHRGRLARRMLIDRRVQPGASIHIGNANQHAR